MNDEASPLQTIAIAPRQVVSKAAFAIVVPALVAILGHASEEPKVPFRFVRFRMVATHKYPPALVVGC